MMKRTRLCLFTLNNAGNFRSHQPKSNWYKTRRFSFKSRECRMIRLAETFTVWSPRWCWAAEWQIELERSIRPMCSISVNKSDVTSAKQPKGCFFFVLKNHIYNKSGADLCFLTGSLCWLAASSSTGSGTEQQQHFCNINKQLFSHLQAQTSPWSPEFR